MKKALKTALIFPLLAPFCIILYIWLYPQAVAQTGLRHFGFSGATVQAATLMPEHVILEGVHIPAPPLTLATVDIRWNWRELFHDKKADMILTVKNTSLPGLLKLAPIEGLNITGTVSGALPVTLRGDTATIVNGVLSTDGPGSIHYNPQQLPAFLQGSDNPQMETLRSALTAFDYESLKLTLNGAFGQQQKVKLEMKGTNAAFYKGRQVNLNFNVEGPLDNVIRYGPGSSQIPDNIQQKIQYHADTLKSK